jgi:hypothetical protein
MLEPEDRAKFNDYLKSKSSKEAFPVCEAGETVYEWSINTQTFECAQQSPNDESAKFETFFFTNDCSAAVWEADRVALEKTDCANNSTDKIPAELVADKRPDEICEMKVSVSLIHVYFDAIAMNKFPELHT